jgi:hypothetical protein
VVDTHDAMLFFREQIDLARTILPLIDRLSAMNEIEQAVNEYELESGSCLARTRGMIAQIKVEARRTLRADGLIAEPPQTDI